MLLENTNNELYRYTNIEQLKEILETNRVNSYKEFTSFTLDHIKIKSSGIGSGYNFRILIIFDKQKLFQKNGANRFEEVWYEPDFMKQFPKICKYVTGYSSEEEYSKDQKQDDPDFIPWESLIQDYEEEQEVVGPRIIRTKDCIIKIICSKTLKSQIEKFQNNGNYNIIYE